MMVSEHEDKEVRDTPYHANNMQINAQAKEVLG
jgi:hypothetical protein